MPQETRSKRKRATLNPLSDMTKRPARKKRAYIELEAEQKTYSKRTSDAIIAKDYLQRSHLSSFDPEGAQLTNMISDILKLARLPKTLKCFAEECFSLNKCSKLIKIASVFNEIDFEYRSTNNGENTDQDTTITTSDEISKENHENAIVEVTSTKKIGYLTEEDLIKKLEDSGVIPSSVEERLVNLDNSMGLDSNIPMSVFSRLKRLEDVVLEFEKFMKGE
eukprot:NODE_21_length_38511_cov_0.503306.p11 type:complete len:221 gc:universal NODE_21_length_38511_cov_0.503306:14812-14150(-)